MPDVKPLIDHLFRRESGRLVAALTRIFGTQNLELAEDVVQETLLKALEHWKFHGVPDNPTGWLFTVARNKALDVVRRERHHKEFAAEFSALLKTEYTAGYTLRQQLHDHLPGDEMLRMMFVCCHPEIQEEARVALILKTLSGLSVQEIARAFLTNEETITKRLYRARQFFRENQISFTLPPPSETSARLSNVLTAIYLIFNEGYHATDTSLPIRENLVEEALRLGHLLTTHEQTRQPDTLALLALMCFQAARLYARIDDKGDLVLLRDQDRTAWNKDLIKQGIYYLQQSSQGEYITSFHFEAAIAHEHCIAPDYDSTNWARILQQYDWLMQIRPDGHIALNRLIAYAEVHGIEKARQELAKINDRDLLRHHSLYPSLLGEWSARENKKKEAITYFEQALRMVQSPAEQRLLKKRIAALSL